MSKPVPKWSCVIRDGKLHLEARSLFEGYVKRLKDGVYSLTLVAQARPKSHGQLGYLFGVVYPIAGEYFGYPDYEVEALHDACIRQLRGLRPEPNPLQLREGLRDKDHAYVSAYIEDLRHWLAVEHGCVTPDAEKVVVPDVKVPKAA
jgi:hypothetical protein